MLTSVTIYTDDMSTVIGCHASYTAFAGILCRGSFNSIQGNRVQYGNWSAHPGSAGIHLAFAPGSRVSHNTIAYCKAAGIRLLNASNGCVLEQNFINGTLAGGALARMSVWLT
jgi:parallel beta-helix repeat protein